MCGIIGVARHSEAPATSAEVLRRMASAIRHRGPDDEGFYSGEGVALGMRRLSIIDLAGGHQPLANEDETLWLVCNGEIYNFRELRAGLQKRGHSFRTGSDVEVLLHLYEESGEHFLESVSGMFALALWDVRRRRLVMARDRLGIKPLYYSLRDGRLAFASEVKALLELPFIQADIDPEVLSEYLSLGYAVAPRTLFRGIRKLPPATMLIWDRDGARTREYWSIPRQVRDDLDEDGWAELIRSELKRAVTEHMVSDVPIGAFLSGGIDSSAVVAFMAAAHGQPVNTYSIGYAGGGAAQYYDELAYARQVAQRFATHHTEIPVAPDVTALLPKLLWHVEEPISDSAIITTYLVSELAARSVKVILSGVGGDELFAGYQRYLGDHYGRQYRRIPAWLRRGIGSLAGRLPSGRHSRMMDLARYARQFLRASELPWREQYRMFVQICARESVKDLLRYAPAAQDGFDGIVQKDHGEDSLLRLMRVDAETQLAEDLLLLTDKVTMATSIECRVPFLDHRLVEVASAVPAAVKLRGGRLKHVLKKALVGVLPDEILNRGKRGFGAPMGAWFKSELKNLRSELLSQRTVESRGLLSWPGVQRALAAHDSGREDYTDLVLVLVNLEIWCRLFLDRRSSSDVADELNELTLAA
jgi:asparagine synthase (glutamine-hydrolysing)